MKAVKSFYIVCIPCFLAACVHLPSGPSIMALPGTGKSFEQFRMDDYECRSYAFGQVGGTSPRQSAQSSGLESAAIGAGLGAAAGAAIAGGGGAAVGAGAGLLAGGLVGSGTASSSAYVNQQRYDIGYIQCMYAKGHRVPIAGRITEEPLLNRARSPASPPAEFIPPPPPPGSPPPPPLR